MRARKLLEAILEQEISPVDQCVAELAKLGWKVYQNDDPDEGTRVVYIENRHDVVITLWIYVADGTFHAYGVLKKDFEVDTKHGSATVEKEEDVENIDSEVGESPASFARTLNDTFSEQQGPRDLDSEDYPEDAVGADYGYHKTDMFDRF